MRVAPAVNEKPLDSQRLVEEEGALTARFGGVNELSKARTHKSSFEQASLFSRLHFFFMIPVVKAANKLSNSGKSLDPKTLPEYPWKKRPEVLQHEFLKYFEKQKQKYSRSRSTKTPRLWLAIFQTFKWEWLLCVKLELLCAGLSILLVWITKRLLDSLSDTNAPVSEGFMWAGIMAGVLICSVYLTHQYICIASLLPQYIRSGIISMIYSKISRLSVYSLNRVSSGTLMNLISQDLNIFESLGFFCSCIFTGVIVLVGSTALLWNFFGISCLVGICYSLLGYPIQQYIISLSTVPHEKKNQLTDERVKITGEIIDSMRLMKMYSWEFVFRDIINILRRKEIKLMKKITVFEILTRTVAFSIQIIGVFLIWMTYVLLGNELTVSLVFSSSSLIFIIKEWCMSFAFGLNFVNTAKIVFKRIEDLMNEPEMEETLFLPPKDSQNAIEFKNFRGYWEKENGPDGRPETERQTLNTANKPTLVDINLHIKQGTLNALIGKVGSGKSSFLMALTGEMPRTQGTLRKQGRIAYVGQEPSIFSGTIRDNILFGKAYNSDLYKKVIKACNLKPDIETLPKRDLSEIGEKGINLSGGQKTRVALARAIYADADIYLLDDPLSAVDAKVAKDLYQNALVTLLKGKTVLLATHQVHFVKNLENIIAFQDGKILGNGNYEILEKMDIDVNKLFNTETPPLQPVTMPIKKQKSVSKTTMYDELWSVINSAEQSTATILVDQSSAKMQIDSSIENPKPESNNETGKLFTSQDDHKGNVSLQTYKAYISNINSKSLICLLFFLLLSNEMANIAFSTIAGIWADGDLDKSEGLAVLGSITGYSLVIYFGKSILLSFLLLRSATSYHNKMLDGMLKYPVQFFDTNPVGRILNRFTNDLGVLDAVLPFVLKDILDDIFSIISSLITISISSPLILLPIFFILVIAGFLTKFCYEAVKQTRDYDLDSKSPLYSLFSSSLAVITTIRSYKQTDNFRKKFGGLLHDNIKGSVAFILVSRFFGFSIDLVFNIGAIGILFIITAVKNSNPTLIGLSVSLILSVYTILRSTLRQGMEINVMMASVARIEAYCQIPSEGPLELAQDKELEQNSWPQQGQIEFNNVSMRYRKNTEYVIRNLTLLIKPGEKIACVGRTGAGKSSIIQALFRMVHLDSHDDGKGSQGTLDCCIKIDSVDIQSVGLHLLRDSISIIPQTPFIFTGTIRKNLDPKSQFSDDQIWKALEDVNLKTFVEKLESKLDTDVSNTSSIFSAGQKQLICLARVILKKSKILVLDEATANVDSETDAYIQKMLREKFKGATILTIAHRLSTIADYDRVLVLDKGMKVEFDEPYKLLVKNIDDNYISNESGHFASMVLNTGQVTSAQIFQIAKDRYLDKIEECKT